ncbi:MAG: hypothetical protein R2762_06420 [Bryobacteraceae bacterium]
MLQIRAQLPNVEAVRDYLAGLIGTEFGRNVVAVGIGRRLIQRHESAEPVETTMPAVRVYVTEKPKPDEIGSRLMLPKEYLGVPVDVIKISGNDFRTGFGRRRKGRAAIEFGPGASIGPAPPEVSGNVSPVLSGTLGAFVKDTEGTAYILSCNHVLSANGRVNSESAVLSPAPVDVFDVGKTTEVAKEIQHVPLETAGENEVDCAVAGLTGYRLADIEEIPTKKPALGDKVVQLGKQQTTGKIVDLQATLIVDYSFGSFRFKNQILIQSDPAGGPFALDGDSGALVVGKDDESAVGLLFAPAGDLAVACPIDRVLEKLKVQLLSARAVKEAAEQE